MNPNTAERGKVYALDPKAPCWVCDQPDTDSAYTYVSHEPWPGGERREYVVHKHATCPPQPRYDQHQADICGCPSHPPAEAFTKHTTEDRPR